MWAVFINLWWWNYSPDTTSWRQKPKSFHSVTSFISCLYWLSNSRVCQPGKGFQCQRALIFLNIGTGNECPAILLNQNKNPSKWPRGTWTQRNNSTSLSTFLKLEDYQTFFDRKINKPNALLHGCKRTVETHNSFNWFGAAVHGLVPGNTKKGHGTLNWAIIEGGDMKTICKRRSITEFTEPLKHEIKKSDLTGDSIRAVFLFCPGDQWQWS